MVVLEDNVDGRDTLRDEVVMAVIPSFQKFIQKQKDKEFNKSTFCFTILLLDIKSYCDLFHFALRSSKM